MHEVYFLYICKNYHAPFAKFSLIHVIMRFIELEFNVMQHLQGIARQILCAH